MNLFVPNCKTELILTKDWTFRLYFEDRCDKLLETSGIMARAKVTAGSEYGWRYQESGGNRYRGTLLHEVYTLPKGSVLRVSRVYIRQNTSDTYDSITFSIKKCSLLDLTDRKGKKKVRGRFWAKLADVNKMKCEVYLGEGAHDITPNERKSRIEMLFED